VADSEPTEHIDAIGLFCPEPVMLLHAAMRRLAPGAALTLRATDPSTQRDIAHFCEFLGHDLLTSEQQDEQFFYHIRKARR
jgi:tRNA 2-thiouridine synthesizing protein A